MNVFLKVFSISFKNEVSITSSSSYLSSSKPFFFFCRKSKVLEGQPTLSAVALESMAIIFIPG